MRKPKLNKLSLFKISPTHTLKTLYDKILSSEYIEVGRSKNIRIFHKQGVVAEPKWVGFIRPLLNAGTSITNKNNSCIILKVYNSKLFAITCGYGHTVISPYCEEDFGLSFALRAIDDENIVQLAQREFRGNVKQLIRTVNGYKPSHDKRNFNRILKSIIGKGEFLSEKISIVGHDSISLSARKNIREIEEVLIEIEGVMALQPKIEIPKNYSAVVDQSTIDTLNQMLIDKMNSYLYSNGSREELFLEAKNPIDQFACIDINFEYQGISESIDEIDLDQVKTRFLEKIPTGPIDKHSLESISIIGKSEHAIELIQESLYDLLTYECRYQSFDYIKLHKKWYKISNEFIVYLDSFLKNLPLNAEVLPDWDRAVFDREKKYNTNYAQMIGGVDMDQEFVHDKYQKLEFCDVYKDGKFFHIKETWGSMSSYLFLQGTTSMNFFLSDASFKNKCITKWPSIGLGSLKKGTIVYGVGIQPGQISDFPKNMTFFAKLNLVEACSIIYENQWDVSISTIKMV